MKGNAIKFTFNIDAQGQQAPVTYDGTVEKNTMKGKLDIGGMVNGTFTATKKWIQFSTVSCVVSSIPLTLLTHLLLNVLIWQGSIPPVS